MDAKNIPFALFLGLSKAFNALNHAVILSKLHYHGIRKNASDWFKIYSSKRRVMWGKTPTLRIHAHILIANGWISLKLIHNQIRLKFLTYIYFRCEILDILEIKRLYKFYTKMGVLIAPYVGKTPTILGKTPTPVYCQVTVMNFKVNYHIWQLKFYCN